MRYKYLDEKKEHLHTLDGKQLYGTSTICKIISKPLTWWAAGKSLEPLGWMNAKTRVNGKYSTTPIDLRKEYAGPHLDALKGLSLNEYIELLDECYRAHDDTKKTAGVKGTDRHALLETYVKHCIETNAGLPTLDGMPEELMEFGRWAVDNVKQFLWSEVNCYSELHWLGGIADVGWIDKQDRIVAGDFKSSKEAYFDQFLQIAGYDIQLTENGGFDKDGNSTFTLPGPIKAYCVLPFGAEKLEPNLLYDVESYKEGFKSALNLHKLQVSFSH